jgi:hypothetical protein
MAYNIDPKLWGKHFWATAHYITLSYPSNPTPNEKQNVKIFFEVLAFLLPCGKCRSHYANNLKVNPLTDNILSSKYKLIEWLVNLHNEVNTRTGKRTITVDEAIQIYTQPVNTLKYDCAPLFTILLLILLILILVYYAKFSM